MRNEIIKKLFDIVKKNKEVYYKGMSYHDQLKTKEWKHYRLYIAIANRFTCELCGNTFYRRFNIHHKKYINGLMAWQYDLKDVAFLCYHHHFMVHRPELAYKFDGMISVKQVIHRNLKEKQNG